MRRRAWAVLLGGAALVAGCAAPVAPLPPAPPIPASAAAPALPPAPPPDARPGARGRVVARSATVVVYAPAAGDTLPAIAARLLGDERRAWQIAEANGQRWQLDADDPAPLAVPLRHANPTGVTPDGVQAVPILCYHRFGTGSSKMTVAPAQFEAQMDWLARNHYTVLRLSDLAGFLAGRQALPQRAVVITIDDGYESAYHHAWPVLRRLGFPATLFVVTDFIDSRDGVNWAQLQDMAASGLVDVQAHSRSHRNLIERAAGETDASYRARLDIEVRQPRSTIERRLAAAGVQVRHYAYPYGDANELVVEQLRRQGYELGLTVTPGGNPFYAHPLMLRRTMIFGDHGLEAFKARLQGRPVPTPTPAPAAGVTPRTTADATPGGSLAEFERQQHSAAEAAQQRGRWPDALAAWDVLLTLHPADTDLAARRAQAQAAQQAAAEQALARARQARQRGDAEGAARAFLDALAALPGQPEAAEGLRLWEQDKVRRQQTGQPNRFAPGLRREP